MDDEFFLTGRAGVPVDRTGVEPTLPRQEFSQDGPPAPPWELWVTPAGDLIIGCDTRPNAWVRLWQRILLGWHWKPAPRTRSTPPPAPSGSSTKSPGA